eukprot:TRINITY_DN128_c0_g1_i1.p1 TRINITY_DN128_c0_g1~~TRINITY_DN128_c0_g1_i1.p1  ORF type:complete len:130 (+),score=29.91 TRINITY_DN128_c0_g1_i1:44-433(+)
MAAERSDAEYQQSLSERTKLVNNKLNMGNGADALREALQDPPLGCKAQATRDNSVALVIQVLGSVKDADIPKALGTLQTSDLDVLMKYIYKGLESGDSNSNALLKWHAAVTKEGGLGCIVRALAERRTL